MHNNLFDINKVNLIIELAKKNIEKNGQYQIICKLNNSEIIEISKYFNINHIKDINDYNVFILKPKI